MGSTIAAKPTISIPKENEEQKKVPLNGQGAPDHNPNRFKIRTSSSSTTSTISNNSPNPLDYMDIGQGSRVRSFPHIQGNYALHVFIPVYIPPTTMKNLALFLKRIAKVVPELHVVDVDIPLSILCKDNQKFEQVALGREVHISLGRTVPIRVHQIDSILAMLRQKFSPSKQYWIDFTKWEVFVNDERIRSFLAMEVVAGGLAEITRQIQSVNEIYRFHNLPEFYKDPRPHISLAWASGNVGDQLKKRVTEDLSAGTMSQNRCIFTCEFKGIKCRIGNKQYKICNV
ncbi:U6 snRNA phosphodiesterase-like [Papaver somniferum]|nr:U6 snRNA phosphodiesterase-like [Papaver somniferum]